MKKHILLIFVTMFMSGCLLPPSEGGGPKKPLKSAYISHIDASGDQGKHDSFGITKMYESLKDGKQWRAMWDKNPRNFTGRDPADPVFDADHGEATYIVAGDGTLKIGGEIPRMYIYDPGLKEQWKDVEITMYFKRVEDKSTPWGGMVSFARTNHGTTGDENIDKCDTRGIGARMRYDGYVDFEKETSHPESGYIERVKYWQDGMPYNKWIGYKHVVYDLPDGNVKQELYIDETEGANGGTWKKLIEYVDDGTNFGAGQPACNGNVQSTMKLSKSEKRAGSESGKPNITVYFRSDDVGENGLVYKWGSVREILAPL